MGPEALIVIPVRGGSVGIPRKALKPLAGMAPLVRTLSTVRGLGTVLVTTDDAEIHSVAFQMGALVVPEVPSNGTRPLDPIITRAITGQPGDIVVTVQCTCP